MVRRCKFPGKRGILGHVMKIDGCLARSVDFEVKTRRKALILTLRRVKFEEVSHEMLVLMLQHVSSRVAGAVASVCGGSCKNPSLLKVSKQAAMSFCVAGEALRDFPTCFKTCQKSFLCGKAQYFCHVFRRCVAFFVASAALWTPPVTFCLAGAGAFFSKSNDRAVQRGDAHQSTLYTLHATL